MLQSRPSSLHATRTGGYSDVEMFFDGTDFTLFGKNLDGYTQINAPGTVDPLFDVLRDRGVAIPDPDLLLGDVNETLIGDVIEVKYIGHGVVGGIECDHLAFRNQGTDWQLWIQGTDWQLWIERGDNAILRKFVTTSKAVGGAPQYTLTIRDWQPDVEAAASAFSFAPPDGAKELDPDVLSELSEIPPSAESEGQLKWPISSEERRLQATRSCACRRYGLERQLHDEHGSQRR